MLQLDQVSLRRGHRLLFQDAKFQIHSGQRMGITGANGSGKSSLFAMLLGELDTDLGEYAFPSKYQVAHVAQSSPQGQQPALEYVIDGDQRLRQLQKELANCDPAEESRLHRLYEEMEAIDGYQAENRAAKLLSGLGFDHKEVTNPVSAFSGGWRMRLNLAQALMCRSDLLLLDEPTNHLDLPTILWLEQWLKAYPGILLVISHDRDFMDSICTHIAHIEHQQINTYTGNYSQFEKTRAEQLAQQQAAYEKQQKEMAHMQSFVDRFRYKASKAKQAQSRIIAMERMTKIAPAHVDSPFQFSFMEPKKQPQQLLKLEEVTVGYGETKVVGNINFRIQAEDRIGLLGVNGAGKSTLVKALADGSTLLSGERSTAKDCHIGYFAQHQLEQLNLEASPMEHMLELFPEETEQTLRNYLGGFGFQDDRIFEPVAPFSGGEKARLVLALMIRQQPNLLLLDEPTNHLDLEMRHALSMALATYSGALVVIAHDRHLLRSVCDQLFIVHDSKLEEYPDDLDSYSRWMREKTREAGETKESGTDNRKQQRQQKAELRQRLKPLTDRVRKAEKALQTAHEKSEQLQQQLSDESLYTDNSQKDQLTKLLKDQAEVKAQLQDLELEWLEASEALEQAQSPS